MIKSARTQYVTTIAAIDREGIVFLWAKHGTNKSKDFVAFLEELSEEIKTGREYDISNALLFFDNAAIHKTNEVKKCLQEKGLRAVTNCPYLPELNPCERFILAHKGILKQRNLNL